MASKDEGARLNLTDGDAKLMKGKQNNHHMGYNTQVVINGLRIILHCHVSTSNSDKRELKPCIEGVMKNTGLVPANSCFDSGYSSFLNEEYLYGLGICSYIPHQDFFRSFAAKPYHRRNFEYDEEKDRYTCPEGKLLTFSRRKNYKDYKYRVYKGTDCQSCAFREECTTAKYRTIDREGRQWLIDETAQRLESPTGVETYEKRKHKVESIFGNFRHNLAYNFFLLRGIEKVEAEFVLMCLTFNIRKMAYLWGFIFICFSLLCQYRVNRRLIPVFQRTF